MREVVPAYVCDGGQLQETVVVCGTCKLGKKATQVIHTPSTSDEVKISPFPLIVLPGSEAE